MARLDDNLYSDESDEEAVRPRAGAKPGQRARTSVGSDKGGDGRDGDMDQDDGSKVDGDDEEDKVLSSLAEEAAADAAAAAAAEGKPKKHRPRFTEDDVIGFKGIERVYTTFPSLCPFRGEGHEAEDLHRLLRCYKEWAYQLFPHLAFEDLVDRMQKLSGKARVRQCLEGLREKERERYLVRMEGEMGREGRRDGSFVLFAAQCVVVLPVCPPSSFSGIPLHSTLTFPSLPPSFPPFLPGRELWTRLRRQNGRVQT